MNAISTSVHLTSSWFLTGHFLENGDDSLEAGSLEWISVPANVQESLVGWTHGFWVFRTKTVFPDLMKNKLFSGKVITF